MKLLETNYLETEHLNGFDNYKYSSIDTSPISTYITHPFWEWCVKFCPKWLAPNLMTFVGFLLLVANFFLLTFYDPNFLVSSGGDNPHQIPSWVWLFCFLSQFLAHTLDGCDGKQARRTGSSTPLGELFDHGLDSWSCLFVPIAVYSVFGRSLEYSLSPLRFYFVIYLCCLQFYLSHWEKYNTGVLFLPWGYDASQLALMFVYLVTFFFGVDLWKFTFPVIHLSFAQCSEIFFYLAAVAATLPMSLWNIYKSVRDGTGKGKTFWEGNQPWVPLVVLFILTTIWACKSPTNILESQPRLFYWMCGTIFSNITCRLIVAQMSSTRSPAFNSLLVVLLVSLGLIFIPYGDAVESSVLWVLSGIVTLAHIHYGVCIVRQMSDHFRIFTFSLAKKYVVGNGEASKSLLEETPSEGTMTN